MASDRRAGRDVYFGCVVEQNLDRVEKLDATLCRGLPIGGTPQSPPIGQGKP